MKLAVCNLGGKFSNRLFNPAISDSTFVEVRRASKLPELVPMPGDPGYFVISGAKVQFIRAKT